MQKDMLAAYTVDNRQMELRRIPVPQPGPGELLIRIRHVGVCGSDLHAFMAEGARYKALPQGGFILGHEGAGEVVALGEGVQGFAVGDKVALEPGSTCGKCEFCKRGLYNLCPDVQFLSVCGQRDGVLREYACHPADLCFKLPENMDTLQGALIEPVAVGMHAASLSGAGLGMDAVIFGAGCIGLMTLLALKARGVGRIAVCDVADIRLQKAKELGAALTINSAREDAVSAILDFTAGRGADVVFDASGNPAAIGLTQKAAKSASTIVLVGNPSGAMPDSFDLQDFVNRELTLRGVFRYRNIYPTAIAAVAAGILPVQKVADRIYPFAQTQQAFDESIDNKAAIVKAVIAL